LTTEQFHIIAFDVPYPPNYGGIVDVYYKLKNLHATGGKIIYHCFYYAGHNPPTELLEQYCDEIYYYPRKKKTWKLVISRLPYVVYSRDNKALLNRLLKDDYPILFDGIQTCYFMNHPEIVKRKRVFRANNIEHKYYEGLALWETSWLKKQYLLIEAKRLAKFEKQLKGVDAILSVAKMDISHFSQYATTHHIPPFFNSENRAEIDESSTVKQVLFQGNLAVKENEHAAKFILENIAQHTQNKIVIAGKDPSKQLIAMAATVPNVELIPTPSIEVMDALIRNSQVNLLMTFQQTGIKLKLLHALESGQHIIMNDKMDDSGIFAALCHVENEPKLIAAKIDELMLTPLTQADKTQRDIDFAKNYGNENNARKILGIIGI
tara:strand:- start:31285 stop:32418 length:1134 start_codon:yes stop_codon:yes gene_type:complete